MEEEICQPLSASIKQKAGEPELISLATTGRLQGSVLLPCFLTALKIGLCIEPESLASQSLAGFKHGSSSIEGKNFRPLPSPLSLTPPRGGGRAEGLFPSQCWPRSQAHPHAPIPAFTGCCQTPAPGVKGMLSNLWNFFSAKKQVTFEFRIPFRPPEQAHCRSLQSPGLPQQTWRGLFPAGRGVRLHSGEVMRPCPAASTGG